MRGCKQEGVINYDRCLNTDDLSINGILFSQTRPAPWPDAPRIITLTTTLTRGLFSELESNGAEASVRRYVAISTIQQNNTYRDQ